MGKKFNVKKAENKNSNSNEIKKPKKWKRNIFISILFLIIIIIIAYFGFKFFSFVGRVSSNWREIEFAYEKPTLIRSIREDYQKKQNELDNSFLKKQQTAQEKLLEEVANKLKTDSLK